MQYIDKHYSNPSFIVEYNLKSTNILMSKEFKNLSYDTSVTLINNKYNINKDMFEKSIQSDTNIYDKYDKDKNYYKPSLPQVTKKKPADKGISKEFNEYMYESKDNFYFQDEPMLNDNNITILARILQNNYFKLSIVIEFNI